MKLFFSLFFVVFSILCSFSQKQQTEFRTDFKKFFEQNNVEGTCIVYDQNKNKYFIYNETQSKKGFIPASTFKIINSLIGLETGVIKDENFVIKWDSVVRSNTKWNKDHDLKNAFKNSTVWYYQELARRVGGKQMKHFLDTVQYGNADTTGRIDKFWLNGEIRITALQQIEFLKKLHDNKLPFSKRNTDIVKKIMIYKDTTGYVMRCKTGWGFQEQKNIGWLVGYIEKGNNVYYFANCIQSPLEDEKDFAKKRFDILYAILNELKIITFK